MLFVTGYICVGSFVLLAVKYILRNLGLRRANAFLMRLHEAYSAALLLSGTVHLVCALIHAGEHSLLLLLSGGAAFLLVFVIIAACHMTKDKVKRMKAHRWLSLAAAVCIAVHIAAHF